MEDSTSTVNLSEVQKCVDRLHIQLQKGTIGSVIYLDSLRSNTAKLLLIITGQEKACKYLVSEEIRGFDILISLLENVEDVKVVNNVCLILKELLTSKNAFQERYHTIVSLNGIHILLRVLVNSSSHSSDDAMASLYNILSKLGNQDRKFAVKARLMGTLPVVISHAKFYIHKPKVLQPILRFCQCVLNNNMNATVLGKEGLVSILLSLIDYKQKNSLILSSALDIMAAATRSKLIVLQIIQLNGLGQLVQMLEPSIWSRLKLKGPKLVKVFRCVLQVLVRLSYTKNGREALIEVQVAPCLLQWCQTLPVVGENWDKLATLASLIIQRCLPPLVLPVASFLSPVYFSIPEDNEYVECESSICPDKEVYGEMTFDISPCNSDPDSDSDDSEDSFPSENSSKTFETEDMEFYKKFFPELESRTTSVEKNAVSPCEEHLKKFILDLPSSVCYAQKNGTHNEISPTKTLFASKSEMDISSMELCRQLNPSTSFPQMDFLEKCNDKSLSNEKYPALNSESAIQIQSTSNARPMPDKKIKPNSSMSISEVYQKIAEQTNSVYPFVKLAYPDLVGGVGCDDIEPLHQKHPGLYRLKVLNHAGNRLLEHMVVQRTVYEVDDIIKISEDNKYGLFISNDDEEKIGCSITTTHLLFESLFESGNLRKVIQVREREYNLILNPDLNTTYHHQWFYFQVSGMEAQVPYTFNIINCEKTNSLFNNGMNPLMFSVKEFLINRKGWTRTGWDICYYRNHYTRDNSVVDIIKSKPYYTLTFTVIFPYSKDICYLAYHYPYTYSLLQTHIYFWEKSADPDSIYFKKDTLCESVAGNPVPILTITALPHNNSRQYIFLTSRVHPGESNSSWVMKGSIDFILSNDEVAKKLRETFIFKIVPMLNPDGVINGCYRCSLSGQDLNRQWLSPISTIHPTIYHTKALLQYLRNMNIKPMLYCDYHGHSRKQNVFLYGCSPSESWWSNDRKKADDHIYQVLPLILHHTAPAFNIENCSFAVEKSRESTGRITVWRQFGIALSYTMECTYGGCNQGIYDGYHLGVAQIEEMGSKFCQALGKLIPDADSPKSCSVMNSFDSSLIDTIKATQLILFNKKQENESSNLSPSEYEDDDDDYDEEGEL
ncbi:cytosolic carboxypeptidase 1-like [Centruroides vittatus]|uniref:cytosolic carboxypeptidase 1-like n=1 Tax=Centruroides vittatus TaxID=120091 RepID=UPI00350F3B9D